MTSMTHTKLILAAATLGYGHLPRLPVTPGRSRAGVGRVGVRTV